MVTLRETYGLWERSLIAWPDGRRDTTTYAGWLQGPSLFGDLRQPIDPPAFAGLTCLNDLDTPHFGWLARQEGFAGRFVTAGTAFEWQRMIDFQCPSSASDAGYLAFVDGVLVEEGRDVPYIEHWHQSRPDTSPLYAIRLKDDSGRDGFLVRAGSDFIYVRNRAVRLPHGGNLADLVATASAEEARAMLDCEISMGRVAETSWRITRSSLPYRVGTDLTPSFHGVSNVLAISDLTEVGTAMRRRWTIVDLDVDASNHNAVGLGNDGTGLFSPLSEPGAPDA